MCCAKFSVDTVVVAVLLELGGIFALKEGRKAQEAFLEEKDGTHGSKVTPMGDTAKKCIAVFHCSVTCVLCHQTQQCVILVLLLLDHKK